MTGPNLSAVYLCTLLCVSYIIMTCANKTHRCQFQPDCSLKGSPGTTNRCVVREISKGKRDHLFDRRNTNAIGQFSHTPKDVKIIVPSDPDNNNVKVTWKLPTLGTKNLKYFLLIVKIDSVKNYSSSEETKFFKVHLHSLKRADWDQSSYTHFEVQFQCVPETATSIATEVLFLPLKEHDPAGSSKAPTVTLDKEIRQLRRKAENCMCHSRIMFFPSRARSSFGGRVILTKWPPEGTVKMSIINENSGLVYNATIKSPKVMDEKTELDVVSETLLPQGQYHLKIIRDCPMKFNIEVGERCQRTIIYNSELIHVSNQPMEGDQAHLANTVHEHEDHDDNMSVILTAACVVSVAIVTLVSVGLFAIVAERRRLRATGSISSDDGTSSIRPLISDSPKKDTRSRVAIIYTCDSEQHRSSVYGLQATLDDAGIDVTIVDEVKSPEMWENWIDFTERIADTHQHVLFVVSPGLYRMCHEYKYGGEDRYREIMDHNNGQCVPVVMLNSLRVQRVKNLHGNVQLHLVSFCPERSVSGGDIVKQFLADHRFLNSSFCYELVQKVAGESKMNFDPKSLVRLVTNIKTCSRVDGNERQRVTKRLTDSFQTSEFECRLSSHHERLFVQLPTNSPLGGSEFYV